MVEHLHKFGVVIVRDADVQQKVNQKFTDMLEKYFSKPTSTKMLDVHPELFYEVGTTPNFVEKARGRCKEISEFEKDHKPTTMSTLKYKIQYFEL